MTNLNRCGNCGSNVSRDTGGYTCGICGYKSPQSVTTHYFNLNEKSILIGSICPCCKQKITKIDWSE